MTNVIPLRRALVASHDVLDMGEALELAGSVLSSAGRHVMQLHEPPTDHMLSDCVRVGRAIIDCANALRIANAVTELPADCERSNG